MICIKPQTSRGCARRPLPECHWLGDHAGNPQSFAHAYWLVEPTFTWYGITGRAGWEHLGGDGMHALQAPLGFPLRGPLTGLVKFADYSSNGFARDTGKWWLQLEWTHL